MHLAEGLRPAVKLLDEQLAADTLRLQSLKLLRDRAAELAGEAGS